ncbi:prolyl aminopeptidase [Ramlibacter alkalitolerans]|uniref:Proline iminopeptidase n=2 Tax=Ramlibacter alkalitolerans TaxID=2039631 RepID=A0ABS1JQX7_9BURK|nr:alpha/beta fold hydrolase [Ramlibacter alkalitolerans]MBL0426652.1 alpha/beta fold hydrolase [Ramlibacter alkalitolerans]
MIVHRLPVGDGHAMHVEEHGDPDGIPALVLHGGPGSGQSPALRSFLDPARYRILCPDQRGAGQSTPAGSVASNTLSHLVADLRLLQSALAVRQWLVVGGSWGATLALAHALDHPTAVSGLLLRNVFLARRSDIDAFFARAVQQGGAPWQALAQHAREAGVPLLTQLAGVFSAGTSEQQRTMATAWARWEQRLSGEPERMPDDATVPRLVQRYRIQSHYLEHACWLDPPPLLERCHGLPGIPLCIVHGTQDAICPPEGATALQQHTGGAARVHWVEGAGHQATDPRMLAAMRAAADSFAQRGAFD